MPALPSCSKLVGTMAQLAQWIAESDKAMVFQARGPASRVSAFRSVQSETEMLASTSQSITPRSASVLPDPPFRRL